MTTPFIQVIHQEQVQSGVKGVSQQLKNLTDFLIDKINAPAVKVPNFEEVRQGDIPTNPLEIFPGHHVRRRMCVFERDDINERIRQEKRAKKIEEAVKRREINVRAGIKELDLCSENYMEIELQKEVCGIVLILFLIIICSSQIMSYTVHALMILFIIYLPGIIKYFQVENEEFKGYAIECRNEHSTISGLLPGSFIFHCQHRVLGE